MLLRNREVKHCLIIAIATGVIGSAAAGALVLKYLGTQNPSNANVASTLAMYVASITLAITVLVAAVFMLYTRRRYRMLAHMAEKLDAALSGERSINFHEMNEGELAILSSELDKVIARLNLTVDELQTEKNALSNALADISHQLKTPLTSISLSTELIRRDLSERGDAPETLERVRVIQHTQQRVEDLVTALLKLARIDAGVIQLVKAPVRAEELVRTSFEPLAIAFDIADVAFETSIQPNAQFEGDFSWSVEALGNVLKNCLEHTPAGASVRVTATEDAIACRIRVEDSGTGISKTDLPHIFERFYRGAESERTSSDPNPAGVGIGLALAKSLVTAQGGTISAENVYGQSGEILGAAFTLVFFKTVV